MTEPVARSPGSDAELSGAAPAAPPPDRPPGSRLRGRLRQFAWASVPVWSFSLLAFVPFLRLAFARRRARDWAVAAGYLAAVILEVVFASLPEPNDVGGAFGGVTALVLMGAAAVHTFVAFRPTSALASEVASSGRHAERHDSDVVEAPFPTPQPRPAPADGYTIDTRYRYERLLYAPMRPSQVTAVAVAAVVPVAAGAILVWVLFEPPAKQAVGSYLVIVSLAGALLWLATSPLYAGRYSKRRGELLRVLVLDTLHMARDNAKRRVGTEGQPIAGRAEPPQGRRNQTILTELTLTMSHGFSVFALWPDTEPYLTGEESRGLSALVTRARALRAIAVTATAAAAATLGVAAERRSHWSSLLELMVALLFVAAGSLDRSNGARGETLHRKAQIVAGHNTDILAAYGVLPKAPADRLAALGKVSVSILKGTSGLPESARPGSAVADRLLPQVAAAVGESVETSLRQVLRRPVVANVAGSLSLSLRRLSSERSELDVNVATGADAWQAAPVTGGTRFQLTGGEDRASAPFEVAVDAPGLEVAPPRQAAQVPTVDASKSWTFTVRGDWASDATIWATLYSSGRYVQAVELEADSRGAL